MGVGRYQEELFRAQINNDLAHLGAKFLFYFALLSYLRQMTAHIFLGDRLFRGYWSAENFEAAIDRLTEGGQETTPVLLEHLKNCCHRLLGKDGSLGPPPKSLSKRARTMFGKLETLDAERGEKGLICPFCGELPDEPHAGQVCIFDSYQRLDTMKS